jgi:2-phospho-L-lactate guanylyltransferase
MRVGREATVWRAAVEEAAVLVPVKSFDHAKVRLAAALPSTQRSALARAMGARVLAAALPLPVAVVCDDEEVAAWAASLGARVIWAPGQGLNQAVTEGVACLAAVGVRQVTVAHADLPLATELVSLGLICGGRDLRVVTLVPDRRLDGTNVAVVPTGCGFCFSYGPGSFRRHVNEALRAGLALQVVQSAELAWDIDVPDDLRGLRGLPALSLPVPEAL